MKGRFLPFDLASWVKNTPIRAVHRAYLAAVSIKKLEDSYFEGNPITKEWGYAKNTYSLFQTQLQNALITIDVRLGEYRLTSKLPGMTTFDVVQMPVKLVNTFNPENTEPNTLQKLAFIDGVLDRYRRKKFVKAPVPIISTPVSEPITREEQDFAPKYVEQALVPVSILQAFERIRRNLTAGDSYEQDLVNEARQTRRRINVAVKFLALLLVTAIATQQLSKNFIYKPLVELWEANHKIEFEFREEIQKRALDVYRLEKEKLEFQFLLSQSQSETRNLEKFSEATKTKKLEAKVKEIYDTYQDLSLDGLQNLLADATTTVVIAIMVVAGKKEIKIIRQFLDETLHGLSDNAKAFLIIVTTDTFVGYHSSDGWEVLIDFVSVHFGLPENRDLTLAFIAIVPVFLDALLKFWVFQALTQSSPSTAAIYGEMNK